MQSLQLIHANLRNSEKNYLLAHSRATDLRYQNKKVGLPYPNKKIVSIFVSEEAYITIIGFI
jgi:hypothetical protein